MILKSWSGTSYDLGKMTLAELVNAYFTHYAIQVCLLLAILTCAITVYLTNDPLTPLVAATAAIVLYPIVWYMLHRWVLHSDYLYRWRFTAALWKRIHFDHHQDPNRLDVLFGALHTTLPTILVVSGSLGWWIGGLVGGTAAISAALLTTCAYEFVHCIQHLNFEPRYAFLKVMKERHMMHHFHHEEGNYGIISFWPDRLLGTFYAKTTNRPRSPNVLDLGYDQSQVEQYPWVAELSSGPPRTRLEKSPIDEQ